MFYKDSLIKLRLFLFIEHAVLRIYWLYFYVLSHINKKTSPCIKALDLLLISTLYEVRI